MIFFLFLYPGNWVSRFNKPTGQGLNLGLGHLSLWLAIMTFIIKVYGSIMTFTLTYYLKNCESANQTVIQHEILDKAFGPLTWLLSSKFHQISMSFMTFAIIVQSLEAFTAKWQLSRPCAIYNTIFQETGVSMTPLHGFYGSRCLSVSHGFLCYPFLLLFGNIYSNSDRSRILIFEYSNTRIFEYPNIDDQVYGRV